MLLSSSQLIHQSFLPISQTYITDILLIRMWFCLQQGFEYSKFHILQYYIRVMSVLVQTSFGDLTIDLETQKFPTATYNFLKLCKLKHYNNAVFIKVQKDYVTEISTKKPTTIWQQLGQNKPYFKDQIDMQAKVNSLGLIGTSNSGSNMNNSQFFITLTKAHLSSLNGKHTVFGKVQEGFEVLKKINETYVDQKGRPQMNIRILHTFVLDDPFEDPPNFKEPESPKIERDPQRLQAIEHLEMLEKYSTEKDILEATRKQKAKKQAITLQMIGQLPDANVKPKQNILFVCKLNPVTQERDLQIIFSRFGPIKSVQIVRDWKTGQSLQYGFIQFESQKSCQQAYLKMDGVLIDDRRIKVDFSQSVSKLMPKMKPNQITHHKGGQAKEKMREIVRSGRTGNEYFGQKKYEIVGKDTSSKYQKPVNQQNVRNIETRNIPYEEKKKARKSESSSNSPSSQKERKRKKQKKEKKQRKQQKEKQKRARYEVKERRQRSVSDRSRSQDSRDYRKRSRSKERKSHRKYDKHDKYN